jgi:cytochrome c5
MELSITKGLGMFFLISILFAGCYYDVEEELYPSNACNTTALKYSSDIVSILTNNGCVSCHNNTNPQGSVKLDTHADVKIYVENGRLIGSVNHQAGFKAMPQGSTSKINQCSIDQLKAWIADGAPNN